MTANWPQHFPKRSDIEMVDRGHTGQALRQSVFTRPGGVFRDRSGLSHLANFVSKERLAELRAKERAQELESPQNTGDCVYNNRTDHCISHFFGL